MSRIDFLTKTDMPLMMLRIDPLTRADMPLMISTCQAAVFSYVKMSQD
jgi:hypothetical protein